MMNSAKHWPRSTALRLVIGGIILIASATLMPRAHAASPALTYSWQYHLFTVRPEAQWKRPVAEWYFGGKPAVPPARFLTCGRGEIALPAGWQRVVTEQWDLLAIERSLRNAIAPAMDRPTGAVTIQRNASGSIVFEGVGLTGRSVDYAALASLTVQAITRGISTIVMPVSETQPAITIEDPSLAAMGIREVVSIGESSFAGSPENRRHNIGVGIARFNGHTIAQGSTFSFNEHLGPVNADTGYKRELVIQGARTIPDFGGGLCQVSSTAYRGAWTMGLPITQRRNHSYAVQYYSPVGSDATIYPPNVDLKFTNDTPGALLLQTLVTDDDRAYFIYYGTRDARSAEVFGPFVWGRVAAPKEEVILKSAKAPLGSKKKVSERHDGLKAAWYRIIHSGGSEEKRERVYSLYETRSLTYEIGVPPETMLTASGAVMSAEPPSWLPTSE